LSDVLTNLRKWTVTISGCAATNFVRLLSRASPVWTFLTIRLHREMAWSCSSETALG